MCSVDGLAAQQRPFGPMFLDHVLSAHLTVGQNVGFGLEVPGTRDSTRRVAEVLELVALAGFEPRNPATLSGGEVFRVNPGAIVSF